jgi:hypothetical protein
MRELFGNPLALNMNKLKNFTEPGLDVDGQPLEPVKKQHPWSAADSANDAIILLSEAAESLRRQKDERNARIAERRERKV